MKSAVKQFIKHTFKLVADNKHVNTLLNKIEKNPEHGLLLLVFANAAKDLINCGFYTYQSLNNQSIPEEKRKFVAALDLANGGLMVLSQLALGYATTSKHFEKFTQKHLFSKVDSEVKNVAMKHIKTHEGMADKKLYNLFRLKLNSLMQKTPVKVKTGFMTIVTFLAANVLAKRVIVPFIATPMATHIENKYMKGNNKPELKETPPVLQSSQVQNVNPYNKQTQPLYKTNGIGSPASFNSFTQKGVLFNI